MASTYHRTFVLGALAVLCLWGSAARAATLIIAGAGDGHGVGMSQDGALGYAEHGYGYQAILAHYYTGTALGQVSPKTRVRVLMGGRVRKVPIETYVRGVVSAEMSPQWPLAALEAQAVASRTYALTAHAGEGRFDVYADSRSQVYRGRAAETPASNRAVKATAGQIVTYAGKPAITYFFASSGGSTESIQNAFPGSAPEPWLQGVPDPFDAGPLHAWRTSLSFAAAAKDLSGLVRGGFRGIEVLKRGVSPRIVSANILGSAGTTPVSGDELAARLSLFDTWAYFTVHDSHGNHPEPDRSGAPAPVSVAPSPRPHPPLGRAGEPRQARAVAADPLLLADVPWLLYRAFFSLPKSITGEDGEPVNALLGTVNALLNAAETCQPRAVVACFGAEQAAYRVELYPPYHAHRDPMPAELAAQWQRAPELLASLGWVVHDSEELEADDVMGSLASAEKNAGGRALLLTGDRDMFQAVNECVAILELKKGANPLEVGPEQVRERYGIDPVLVPDFIALRGDPSDGLPGAPGIGAKTAAALLNKHGPLEDILAAAASPDSSIRHGATLLHHADLLRIFKQVATLVPLDIEPPPDTPTDFAGGAAKASELGMKGLAARLERAAS